MLFKISNRKQTAIIKEKEALLKYNLISQPTSHLPSLNLNISVKVQSKGIHHSNTCKSYNQLGNSQDSQEVKQAASMMRMRISWIDCSSHKIPRCRRKNLKEWYTATLSIISRRMLEEVQPGEVR
jgi:hypothetical protein